MNAECIGAWWQKYDLLGVVLPFLNRARECDEQVARCDFLNKALNKTWNGYSQYREQTGQLDETEQEKDRSDAQGIRDLLVRGLEDGHVETFLASKSIRRFAELMPQVMDHKTLSQERYDPSNITDRIRTKASGSHKQLQHAFRRYEASTNDRTLREALLKKISILLYVVRSNIAHGEKTPNGPDLEKRARDNHVSEAAADVIEELFDILFRRPSHRLAVYGSLIPGEVNASQLDDLNGCWQRGVVKGKLCLRDGFHCFRWEYGAGEIFVNVFAAPCPLPFRRLDKFEGTRYQRILAPVRVSDSHSVCNIYQERNEAEGTVGSRF